jgi:hypothetical protein
MPIFYSPSNKGFYDTKVGYSSLPTDIIDVTDRYLNILDLINNKNKTLLVIDNEIIFADKETVSVSWDEIKERRNILLTESDYTQLADSPTKNKEEWAAYRQALRDIPQNFSNPTDVIFPDKPQG